MKYNLFLCGAGNPEGVRLALRVNEKFSRWSDIFILDDDSQKKDKSILGVKIIGSFELLRGVNQDSSEIVNLVARTTQKRKAAYEKLFRYRIPFVSLIDPDLDLLGVEYKNDITVYKNSILSAESFIDSGSVIFSGGIVGHGCKVGKNCIIAPGAVLNARVELGEGVYIGTNASVFPDLHIGDWATVGMNTAVIQSIPAYATAMSVTSEIVTISESVRDSAKSDHRWIPEENGYEEAKELLDDIEEKISEIWSDILKINKININDNFFDLGGHSLSSIQLICQIQKKFGISIPMQKFLDSPTIASLAAKIKSEVSEPGKF